MSQWQQSYNNYSTQAKNSINENEKSHIPFNLTTLAVIINTFIIKPFPFAVFFLKEWMMLLHNKAISFCYNFSKEVNDVSLWYIR